MFTLSVLQLYFLSKEQSELLYLRIKELIFFSEIQMRGARVGLRLCRGSGGVTPGKFLKSRCKMVHSG